MTLGGAARKASCITGLEVLGRRMGATYLLVAIIDGIAIEVGRITPTEALRSFLFYNLDRIRDTRVRTTQGRCEQCSRAKPLHLHHKKFRSQGRDDREENLELLCVACHGGKHS